MRYQINSGFVVGAVCIPGGTVLDYDGKADHELTEFERLAEGRLPPLDITILDADCALVMHRGYHPDLHHRLRLYLDDFNREIFEQLLALPEAVLEHWHV